jgi:hypothetical protein
MSDSPLSQPLANLEALIDEMANLRVGYCNCTCHPGEPLCYSCQQRARLQCWADQLETVRCDLKEAQAKMEPGER